MNKIPRHVAKVATRYEGSGYISSSQYAELEYAAIVDCKEAVAAHAEELERVRREAYRQGVEDANTMRLLAQADAYLRNARECYKGDIGGSLDFILEMSEDAALCRETAFNGARGIARVEIRQRLEQLPSLPRSHKNLDDVDTDAEDHIGDMLRYRVRRQDNTAGQGEM